MPQTLIVGEMVKIYSSPATEQHYEGEAKLEKIIEQQEMPKHAIAYCQVRFVETGLLMTRFILTHKQ